MRVLGIDPGYAIVGWGVVDYAGNRFAPVDFGAVCTDAGVPFERRLDEVYAGIKEDIILGMAYTCSKEEAMEWKQEIMNRFPGYEFLEAPLSLSVSCHIGPGAMAVTCIKKVSR